jgi:hypothetical protein
VDCITLTSTAGTTVWVVFSVSRDSPETSFTDTS